jgi:DNA-binding response OmpR family regulator
LEDEGFNVDAAFSPTIGLKKVRENPPDLLLLDIRLPEMDGFQVCKEIKNDPRLLHIPIIMISIRSEESDVVVGLELGADDYISKPFRKQELIARVKAALRKRTAVTGPKTVKQGPLEVDFGSYVARLNGKTLDLTPKEFELLGFMVQNEGRFVTRAVISQSIWGADLSITSRTVDVHVQKLRKKLGPHGSWISSLRGVGYRFEIN